MERRQAIYGILSVFTVGPLAGCGGDGSPLENAVGSLNPGPTDEEEGKMTLNEIMDKQLDLTKIPPEKINIAGTDFDQIYVEQEPVVY